MSENQETVEAEIKLIMASQRVRDGESRTDPSSANGPLRAQSKTRGSCVEYSATCWHTSVAGDMLVSCRERSCRGCESRWHRG